MSQSNHSLRRRGTGVLSIEELEAGLRIMARGDFQSSIFWDENVEAFRQTVLYAIRETSDALLSSTLALKWRVELQSQLDSLVQYIEFADRYIARRSPGCEMLAPAFRRSGNQVH